MSTNPTNVDGTCIYCLASGRMLTDEHVIPLSLGGKDVLLNASCVACAAITSADELIVARPMYGLVRIKENFPTRHSKRRPKTLPITAEDAAGRQIKRQMPVQDAPNWHVSLEFPPPGILTGLPASTLNPDIKVRIHADTKVMAEAQRLLEAASLTISQEVFWGAFCRVLAKVAHSYLVRTIGKDGYEPLLPDIILHRSEYISHYVGGATTEMISDHEASDFCIRTHTVGSDLYLVVTVQLIRRLQLPIYQIVAGRVTDLGPVLAAIQRRRALDAGQ